MCAWDVCLSVCSCTCTLYSVQFTAYFYIGACLLTHPLAFVSQRKRDVYFFMATHWRLRRLAISTALNWKRHNYNFYTNNFHLLISNFNLCIACYLFRPSQCVVQNIERSTIYSHSHNQLSNFLICRWISEHFRGNTPFSLYLTRWWCMFRCIENPLTEFNFKWKKRRTRPKCNI